MENITFVGFGAVTVLCYLCGQIVKLTALDHKWIPVLCGSLGAVLGILAFLFIPAFPASDLLNAAAEGVVAGLAATGADQAVKQLTRDSSNTETGVG